VRYNLNKIFARNNRSLFGIANANIMRKIFILLSAVSFLLITSCNKEKNFIGDVVSKMEKTTSVHFKVDERYYYVNGIDTTFTPYEVWAVRDNSDTLRHGYVWIDNNYRPYHMIYDKGAFYLAIPPKKITAVYPDYTESFISPVDWIDIFLKPETLQEQFSNPKNVTQLSDTTFRGEACKKLVIEFPADEKSEQTSYTYIISKKLGVLLWAMMTVTDKDDVYYDILSFSDYTFDQVDAEVLHEKQKKVLDENPLEAESASTEIEMYESMLHAGDKAPVFDGQFYEDGDPFALSDYIGKNIIIVDFWYTHCPPCVKAIPSLDKLYKKYKDRGVQIFGLNSVDNQPRSMDYLNKFLAKRAISYDVIMIEPGVDMAYKVRRYPTLYVIDKEGNIALSEVGFNEEKFNRLKEKIEELLPEKQK